MKKYIQFIITGLLISNALFSQTVIISSENIVAANVAQGSVNNIVYIAKVDVSAAPVAVTTLQFRLTGTHDNNDLTTYRIYANSSASLTGATLLSSTLATFAAPHIYNDDVPDQIISAGTTRYFIITFFTNATATNGNSIKVNGATDPVIFTYSTAASVTNNQTDAAGVQTIAAGSVINSTETTPASSVAQGSSNIIVYMARVNVDVMPVTISTLQFTLTGTHDNNDLTSYRIYGNSSPSLSGATLLSLNTASFAAPHAYADDIPDQTIAAGSLRYFIITVFVDAGATSGNTIKLNGAANPVTFSYTTEPVVTNNQTDAGGALTILGSGVTLSSQPVAPSNVAQGSTNNIVYIAKMDVVSTPVTVAAMQFTLSGTHDNNDLATYRIYLNSTPSLTGAIFLANSPAIFAAPHLYENDFSDQTIAAGTTGYFIITYFVDPSATPGNTIKLNGSATPVSFTFTTAPTVNNMQSDVAGLQTIQSAGVTLSSETIPAAPIYRNSSDNIVYILKTSITALAVTVANIQFTLTGTHDNNDFTNYRIYVNTIPSLTGAGLLAINPATFAAPNTYMNDIPDQVIAAGDTRYFIITLSVDAAATLGNTVKVNGSANPVVLAYTTAPPVVNNQTDAAGSGTITNALPVSLLSFSATPIQTQQTSLQWQTANEINTKEFDMEWSKDALQYERIATIAAATNSSFNRQYNYLHQLPTDGSNFYRLKMKDLDGRFTYSPVVQIKIRVSKLKVSVYPNPVSDIMQINFQSPQNEKLLLSLYGSDGKIAGSKTINLLKGNNSIQWNVDQLAAGMYYLKANKSFESIVICKP